MFLKVLLRHTHSTNFHHLRCLNNENIMRHSFISLLHYMTNGDRKLIIWCYIWLHRQKSLKNFAASTLKKTDNHGVFRLYGENIRVWPSWLQAKTLVFLLPCRKCIRAENICTTASLTYELYGYVSSSVLSRKPRILLPSIIPW